MEEMSLREGLEIMHSECKKNLVCSGRCKFYKNACVLDAGVDSNEEHLNKAIEICKQIKEENKMTYAKDFYNKFPNCINKKVQDMLCVETIYGKKHNYCDGFSCTCEECWNQEYKEDKQ